jgi:hypothetical protein
MYTAFCTYGTDLFLSKKCTGRWNKKDKKRDDGLNFKVKVNAADKTLRVLYTTFMDDMKNVISNQTTKDYDEFSF